MLALSDLGVHRVLVMVDWRRECVHINSMSDSILLFIVGLTYREMFLLLVEGIIQLRKQCWVIRGSVWRHIQAIIGLCHETLLSRDRIGAGM